MPDTNRKGQLESRADELTARLTSIEAELDAPAPKDWDDKATEREAEEVLETLGLSGQQELRQIAPHWTGSSKAPTSSAPDVATISHRIGLICFPTPHFAPAALLEFLKGALLSPIPRKT